MVIKTGIIVTCIEIYKRGLPSLCDYETIIIGAGSMGMAAGYYLARNGIKTLLIDSFNPPHSNGSHHGETRIIRHAYGEGRWYVPLALRSQMLWEELEKESGQNLFANTGVLGFGSKDSEFIHEAIASAKTYSLPIELLKGVDVAKRWPGISVPDDFVSFYEPTSGVLFSDECVKAYRDLALKHGVDLMVNARVEDIYVNDTSNIVTISTNTTRVTARHLIVTGGAWSGELLSKIGVNLPLQPTRQTVAWFEADEAIYNYHKLPAFFVDVPLGKYYGFPSFGSGVKVGRHDYGNKITPDTIDRKFGALSTDDKFIREFLELYMPGVSRDLIQGKVCMYTKTPDDHFLLDLHPKYNFIAIAAGFSGHGFKFSSVIGEILSQLVISGKTEYDLSMFSITRAGIGK